MLGYNLYLHNISFLAGQTVRTSVYSVASETCGFNLYLYRFTRDGCGVTGDGCGVTRVTPYTY
jgi:hypothetical protein